MEHIKTDDGIQIAYQSFGEGPRVVFLIHGWMVSGAVFDDLLEVLDRDGLRIIVPDHRGSGASDKPEEGYSIERYALDVLEIADAEKIGSFVAFGHSMGGLLAQWLAAYHPTRIAGLVLGCSVPASGMTLPEEAIGLFSNCGGNRDMQRTILGLACKELSEARREKLLDDSVKTSPNAIRQGFDAWRLAHFSDALSRIRAASLVIGTDDPFLPPAFLRAEIVSKIAGARFSYVPGPGHYLQVERPIETAALLEAFLAALPR